MLSYHMQGIIATIMLLCDDNLFIISLKKDASCVNIISFLVRQRNKTSIKCLFLGMMYSEIISKLIKMMQTCSLPKTFNMVTQLLFHNTCNTT